MAEQSGFFNALKNSNGTYDVKYNANDYSNNMAAIISNGVRRSGDDDLAVVSAGGLALKVKVGRAWINGRWYWNDAEYTAFSVPTPPTGDNSRIDRVILRLNTAIDGRSIKLAYLQGTPSGSPSAPALTRSGSIYEIALADIRVPAAATSINSSNITDQRANKDLCGWITTPVGYDDYFTSLDNQFNSWLAVVKDELASKTMYREYHQRITVQAAGTTFTFSIPQFDPTGLDQVRVAVNGLQVLEGEDYSRNGSIITFNDSKIAGTDIDVTVVKSLDGTGIGSVQSTVDELQEEVATFKNIGEYIYLCNGYDDNVKLSQIADDWFTNGPENGQLTINVYGTFKATAPYSGSGSSTSRYRWMVLGSASASSTKRIVFDFLNCSAMALEGTAGNHYICFYGANVTIRNAVVIARQRNTTGSVVVFYSPGAGFLAEHCRFDVSAYTGSYIAGDGTFRDCFGTVTNSRENSFCFAVDSGLIRVFGGSYTAYTGLSDRKSAVFGEAGGGSNAIIAYGVNCPQVDKSGHYQTHSAYFTTSTTSGLIDGMTTVLPTNLVNNWVAVTHTITTNYPMVKY